METVMRLMGRDDKKSSDFIRDGTGRNDFFLERSRERNEMIRTIFLLDILLSDTFSGIKRGVKGLNENQQDGC